MDQNRHPTLRCGGGRDGPSTRRKPPKEAVEVWNAKRGPETDKTSQDLLVKEVAHKAGPGMGSRPARRGHHRVGVVGLEPRCICLSVLASQSNPSYNPSPRVATVPCTCHLRVRICGRPRCWHTSDGDMAPFKSCLLAKISNALFRIRGSSMIVLNSLVALPIRSRSNESTT
eukprot:scaffold622_cov335-Pavlova_lutheri.AAC.10